MANESRFVSLHPLRSANLGDGLLDFSSHPQAAVPLVSSYVAHYGPEVRSQCPWVAANFELGQLSYGLAVVAQTASGNGETR